jgi:GNAT superfamily N-acetyltransferase
MLGRRRVLAVLRFLDQPARGRCPCLRPGVALTYDPVMAGDPESPPEAAAVLDAIAKRRAAGIADLGAELHARIDELGGIALDSPPLQSAFEEVFKGLTPPEFDLFPVPDACGIDTAGHEIAIRGALVDQANRQVVGDLARLLRLDAGRAEHELLRLQSPYRGAGLATLLLEGSFRLYERCGIEQVGVHAALETGRWYWARLGFEFESPTSRALVTTWGTIALQALGAPPLAFDSPARRWAQLGAGEDPPRHLSLEALRVALSAFVDARLADPAEKPTYQRLASTFSDRFQSDWLGHERFLDCARRNGIPFDKPILLGKAIMLSGPDWYGVFDLGDPGTRAAFAEELNRALTRQAQGGRSSGGR